MSVESDRCKAEGNKCFKNEDYITALVKYTEAIILNKENPVLYSNRALTFIKLQSWDNAINDCNIGLSLYDNNRNSEIKIKSKLSWRLSIALKNSGDFKKAFEVIVEALKLDPNNNELKTEFEILKLNDEIPQTEEPKSLNVSKEKKLTKSEFKSNDIVDIPIQVVDAIPADFFNKPHTRKNIIQPKVVNAESLIDQSLKSSLIVEVSPEPQEIKRVKPSQQVYNKTHIPKHDETFPQYPTLQFLLSIKSKKTPLYYEYILTIPTKHYLSLFKITGVEPEILEVFLDSSIYVLKADQLQYSTKIKELLTLFKNLPRFTVNSMFVDSAKIQQLTTLFKEKLDDNFKNYWQ